MKRRELAMAASLSYPYVSEIENGQKEPSAKALRQLAEALELTPSDLVTLTDRLAAAGDSPSLLLDADQRPESRDLRSDTLGSGLGEGQPVVALATPTQPAGETPGDGMLERWIVETVTRVVRVELARWAAHELPEIVRAEVETAIDGRGKR